MYGFKSPLSCIRYRPSSIKIPSRFPCFRWCVAAMSPERRVHELEQHLSAALPVLQRGHAQVRARQAWYAAATLLCLAALCFLPSLLADTLPWGVGAVVGVVRFLLSVGAAFGFWSAIVLSNRELNGLISVRKDVNNMLRASPNI